MLQREQQYKITDAVITADRFDGKEFEVTAQLFELVLYENLENPYITGVASIVDNGNIIPSMQFYGTEYLTVTITGIEKNSEPYIQKTFIMNKMRKSIKPNDNTEVYIFDLVEPHAYLSSLKTFSRAYSGTYDKIVSQILNGELNKKVDLSYLKNGAVAQGVRKFITPYITPLEACDYIVDQCTSVNGSPVFLYSSIHDENIRMGDLDKMLEQSAFNKDVPYVYSQASVNNTENLDEVQRSTQILFYEQKNMNPTLEQINEGAFGSFYTNTDLATGISYRTHVSVRDTINAMRKNQIIPEDGIQRVYDESQIFQNRLVDEFNPVYWHQVRSSNTYGVTQSYHDGRNVDDLSLKIKSNLLRDALYRNNIIITVSGVAFLLAKATVGDIVNVNFQNSSSDIKKGEDALDRTRTGDYLIYSTRHTFRETRHYTVLGITRLNSPSEKLI